jgi:hypothetical protein
MLDIQNDSNEAMYAKGYFGSSEDPNSPMIDNGDSFQTDKSEIAPIQRLGKSGSGSGYIGKLQRDSSVHRPQPVLGHEHHFSHNSIEEYTIQTGGGAVEALEDPHQAQASRADFMKYMFEEGNWTDLFATSGAWMLLDFTFYLLGVNSSSFVPTMFGERSGPNQPPYGKLIGGERHIMEATSVGALVGSCIAIFVMHHYSQKKIQMGGFMVLGGLFIVVGALYVTLPSTNAHVAIVVLYGVCQLFFNLGECLCNRVS